jgi:transcriptional regulator with GAF, ATPase, and Fis domain
MHFAGRARLITSGADKEYQEERSHEGGMRVREAAAIVGIHSRGEGENRLVGQSKKLCEVLQRAAIVSPTDSTVLVLGETGTGKGCIASAIHEASGRRHHPLVKVNCAAIPLGLLESELFGYERGAFTGAITQRIGRFAYLFLSMRTRENRRVHWTAKG